MAKSRCLSSKFLIFSECKSESTLAAIPEELLMAPLCTPSTASLLNPSFLKQH